MNRILFILILSSFLISCVGIKSEIELDDDGSGTLRLSYKVSQMILHLGRLEDDERVVPLPVNRRDFERTVQSIEGLSLNSYSSREDEENIYIDTELSFQSIEALSDIFSRSDSGGITLTQNDKGDTVYTQVIHRGRGEDIDRDTLEMIETFFKDYFIEYSLTAPGVIKEASPGTTGENRKTAVFKVSIPEYIKQLEPLVWEVIW